MAYKSNQNKAKQYNLKTPKGEVKLIAKPITVKKPK